MGFFEKIKNGLTKTRDQIKTKIEWIIQGKPIEEDAFDEIEEALILADAGLDTTELLVGALKEKWKRGYIKTVEDIKSSMKEEVQKLLAPIEAPIAVNDTKPFVILTLGVNGVGKTTTIAKLASIYLGDKKKVLFGACDTFRAAAIEQLDVWAKRLNVEMVRHADGSDPAAVAFDTVKAAKSRGSDIVFLDTAGRLHTKANLMEEMKKIHRVISKEVENAPHEILLVVDATNGQNAIAQAKAFNDAVGISGIVITKLDGTAKGGFILPIAHLLKIPVRYIGVGEKIDDLIPFNAKDFAEAMFD
ncbi:MAG: signal recognition particle-docking protein FtsY [Syntrophorhabdaceae bacterium]|mgnify:CR=1 FL=1|nr:signal recognition particle-docking protein FtsY [Syntrophorhabdaceae bacterium]MDD4196530.1 signal recognition particle-docking protein FtsY [Syntrophorhabdaceae bacterium]HOC45409.1 signal recognition particle-docking protein FtsY [Syntrophorhabdaceae bacterium]